MGRRDGLGLNNKGRMAENKSAGGTVMVDKRVQQQLEGEETGTDPESTRNKQIDEELKKYGIG